MQWAEKGESDYRKEATFERTVGKGWMHSTCTAGNPLTKTNDTTFPEWLRALGKHKAEHQ